jgi:carbonic anhydrase
MDSRIDVPGAIGGTLDSVPVLRNAGARVTEDVLRSLALACHALGADTLAVMHHTDCRVAGVTDQELRARTGADLAFLPIGDHAGALQADIDTLSSRLFLAPLTLIIGLLYDVETGGVDELVRWRRPQ